MINERRFGLWKPFVNILKALPRASPLSATQLWKFYRFFVSAMLKVLLIALRCVQIDEKWKALIFFSLAAPFVYAETFKNQNHMHVMCIKCPIKRIMVCFLLVYRVYFMRILVSRILQPFLLAKSVASRVINIYFFQLSLCGFYHLKQ